MSDDLELLIARVFQQIEDHLKQVSDDVRELRTRMTAVEENLAGLNRRFDRLEEPMWWTRRTGSDATS